jgi:hypothetical protein
MRPAAPLFLSAPKTGHVQGHPPRYESSKALLEDLRFRLAWPSFTGPTARSAFRLQGGSPRAQKAVAAHPALIGRIADFDSQFAGRHRYDS